MVFPEAGSGVGTRWKIKQYSCRSHEHANQRRSQATCSGVTKSWQRIRDMMDLSPSSQPLQLEFCQFYGRCRCLERDHDCLKLA